MTPVVDVLLSVYGTAPFLDVFLQSLLRQSFKEYRLLYRFDSEPSQETAALLQRFPGATELPGREHLGVVKSYQKLIQGSAASYLMPADQDDVWHDDKIQKSLNAIHQLEQSEKKRGPLLVHSDLRVVDISGEEIASSLFRYQSLKPERNSLRDLMIQNNATGCTMIFNRALADLAVFPDVAICHDWYLAMIAAAFGKIVFLREPLADYRQHAGNVFGAVPVRSLFPSFFQRKSLHDRLILTQRQAGAFLLQFRGSLPQMQIAFLDAWSRNRRMPKWRRLLSVLRYGFRKNDWIRTLGMWWAL